MRAGSSAARRNGITIGAYPDGLVAVEGRLAALLHGEEDHRLLGADEFLRAPEAAADLFGLDLDAAPVGVGRADLASELVFTDGREGQDRPSITATFAGVR